MTHDQAEAMTLSDRIAVVNRGRFEQVGTPDEVYETPATPFVAEFLGRTVSCEGKIAKNAAGCWIEFSKPMAPDSARCQRIGSAALADGTGSSCSPGRRISKFLPTANSQTIRWPHGSNKSLTSATVSSIMFKPAECLSSYRRQKNSATMPAHAVRLVVDPARLAFAPI